MEAAELCDEVLEFREGKEVEVVLLGVDALDLADVEEEEVEEAVDLLLLLDVDVQDALLEEALLGLQRLRLLLLPLADVVLQDLALRWPSLHSLWIINLMA